MSTSPTPLGSSAQLETAAVNWIKHFYVGIILVAAAIVLGLFIHAKIEADAIARQQMKVVQAQTAGVLKTGDQQIAAAQKDSTLTAQQLAQQLAIISAAKQQPVTPVDYDRINAMIAAQVGVQKNQVVTQTDPSGQATTTVPTVQLRNEELTCQACQDQTAADKKQLADLQTENAALTTQKTALQSEVKNDDTIINGGTFKHRVWVDFKQSVCGASGSAGGLGTTHAAGAGVSAGVGVGVFVACELWVNHHPKVLKSP